MFKVNTDAPNDAVRAQYMPALLDSGYTQEDAALIFDLAWQACAEAQETLAKVCNRVPDQLQLATAGLASDMLMKACHSLIHYCSNVNDQRMMQAIMRDLFGKQGDI